MDLTKGVTKMATRLKVSLITLNDMKTFVEAINTLEGTTVLENEQGTFRINAKSFLGIVAAVEDWNDVWVVSEDPRLYGTISKFVI